MKPFFTLIFILLAFHYLTAQERTISGRLTSTEDGSPLPGINIVIKGTSIGTVTDFDGNYSIRVPIGATLVFSFIGMQTRELIVTENNFQSQNGSEPVKHKNKKEPLRPIPDYFYKDTIATNDIGVSTLTDASPSYQHKSAINPATIMSIRQHGNLYTIKSDYDPIRRTGFGMQLTTSLSVEQINKLPSFQSEYSQGRPQSGKLEWQGGDQYEIFSWGPLVRTLEFDGENYPFDKNGRLTRAGTGNGEPAKKYNASTFFRTGIANVNELMITAPATRHSTVVFDLEHRTRTGIIPGSKYKKTNVSTAIRNFKLSENVSSNASISFNRSTGTLLNRGGNLTSIIGGVYRTPVTFDNSNALSSLSALNSNESYALPDGTKRSHAPGVADNPYGLVSELPDHEELQRLMGSLNLMFYPSNPFSIVFNGNIDQQWNTTIFGNAPGYSGYINGRLTSRNDAQIFASSVLTPAYKYSLDYSELKLSLSYQTEYSDRQLDRIDQFNFRSNDSFANMEGGDSITVLNNTMTRTSHEVTVNAQYEYHDWLHVRLNNRSYFSNTIHRNQYTNFFPTVSLSIDFADLLYLASVNDLKLYAAVSRTIREAPLLYSNWSYGSTNIPIENYTSFYEGSELFFSKGVIPETERKFESGLKFNGFNGGLTIELVYFNNQTKDFIAPVNTPNGFVLFNVATIKNQGGTLSAGYSGHMSNGRWGTDLKWSQYNSIVQNLFSSQEWIPLAGFQSVQTVFAKGQPAGAIYGSSYVRNEEGKKIVDNDGFPMKESNLKMIGNPIPDWILGWSTYLQWKSLKLSFLFDFRKGGDVWNGTNSVLDYLGRSSHTEGLRNTANYVFEGVDVNGDPNVKPVNFSDPLLPVTANRWVRYGWDGVAEDYIEDASWIRLNELVLSYTTKRRSQHDIIKEVKFSLIGRNLFLITPYSGVDPSATLFGYGSGNGLDLFNTPSTRSYGAQVTIKI